MSNVTSHSLNGVTVHPLDQDDAPIVAGMRAAMLPTKGAPLGIDARAGFDQLMERVAPSSNMTFEKAVLAGVPGVWVHPESWAKDEAILYLHGGWFNFGKAWAFRFLVGHLAVRTGARAFVPDYRLAPEHPFPAAVDDALACYRALAEQGVRRIAIVGDSAGGNLALALGSRVTAEKIPSARLSGLAAFSPVTDLTLSGASYETRAEADPLFTRPQVEKFVHSYLANGDARHPRASPLFADLTGLPPIRIHVGDDEVLLDDTLRYVERARAADVDAEVDLWMGMPHGFVQGVDTLRAASSAMGSVGAFICERLHSDT